MKKLDPKKEGVSLDIVAENLEKLKTLFPEAVSEDGVNVDVLNQLIGKTVTDSDEKYGLTWHGKRQARQLALSPSAGTLRPCPEESVDWDTTQNLFLEGDNLEVLKLLQKSYANKVKMIYIDPPYNTGKDFVYPDNFRDNIRNYLELTGQTGEEGEKRTSNPESSGRFHTDWLNMMYPRLKIARNFLAQDGLLLVSIDEHEAAHTRKIIDELMGEENFITQLVWEKTRKNDAKLFSVGHEYMFVYARDLQHLKDQDTVWRESKPGSAEIIQKWEELKLLHGDNYSAMETDLRQWYKSLPKTHPSKKLSRYKQIDQWGPWRDRDISWPGGDGPRYDVIHPVTNLPCAVPDAGWRFSTKESMQRQIDLGLVVFREDHLKPPFRKAHLLPIKEELECSDSALPSEEEDENEDETIGLQVMPSVIYKQAQVATKYLRQLMGAKLFDNPKDHEVLARLINYTTEPQSIVMDFFAGSGSTAEAIMYLKSQSPDQRRFILVQLPEKLDPKKKEQMAAYKFCQKQGFPENIAEIGKERIRRAGKKILAEVEEKRKKELEKNPLLASELESVDLDVGFKVFKLDTSNIRPWNPDPDDLEGTLLDHIEHLLPDRTEQDVLYELLLKLGLDLTVPIESRTIAGKEVHAIGFGTLFACLTTSVSRDQVELLAQGIIAWHEELSPEGETTIVFRDSGFANDVVKSNLTAILAQAGFDENRIRSL